MRRALWALAAQKTGMGLKGMTAGGDAKRYRTSVSSSQ